jgi:hypothetical protein
MHLLARLLCCQSLEGLGTQELLASMLDVRDTVWKLYTQEKDRFAAVSENFHDKAKRLDLALEQAFSAAQEEDETSPDLRRRSADRTNDPREFGGEVSLVSLCAQLTWLTCCPVFVHSVLISHVF